MSLKYNNQDIRELIFNNKERYRLEYNNKLLYAKGKINFNLNLPKDGSNNIIKLDTNLDKIAYSNTSNSFSLFAFYDDGFYEQVPQWFGDSLWNKKGSNLNSFCTLKTIKNWAIFDGWYTEKINSSKRPPSSKKIETIKDINTKTDLFKYSSSTSIPTITLYAHWTVKTVTIIVNNIERYSLEIFETSLDRYSSFSSKSHFWYKSGSQWIKKTGGSKKFSGVLVGTDIIKYINSQIKNPRYISWILKYYENHYNRYGKRVARSYLDVSLYNQKVKEQLRSGTYQEFLGWSNSQVADRWFNIYVAGLKENETTKTFNFYPIFQTLICWPHVKNMKNGSIGGSHLSTRNPKFSFNNLMNFVNNKNEWNKWIKYVHPRYVYDGNGNYMGYWNYGDYNNGYYADFPLLSADTTVIYPSISY